MDKQQDKQQLEADESRNRVLSALRRIIRAVDIYSRKLASDHNITSPQLICLSQISLDKQTTLTTLSKKVHLSASTVCGIIDRLRAKKLICSERSESDRRIVTIVATDSGRELVSTAPPLLQDELARNLSKLPLAEVQAIAGALEYLVEMMGVGHIDSAPMLAIEFEPAQAEEDHDA